MKTAVPSEAWEQERFVSWLEQEGYSFCAFSPDPGTTPARRAKRQRMGLRPGFPDMLVVLKNQQLLFLEMKRTSGGKTSPEQKKWLELLRNAGITSEVARGFEEAKGLVLKYDQTSS